MESISTNKMQSLKVCILVISCLLPMGLLANPHGLGVDDLSSGVRMMMRTYSQCQRDESMLWPCLKQRALTLVDRAINKDTITLVDGISLERDASASPVQSSEEQQQQLPQEPEARSQKLDDLLWDRATSFLQSHSLRIKLPSDLSIEEGRGKLKKLAGPILMALMMKKMLAALAIGSLALLAGKALLVSKLALALSLIVALRKLMGGGGGGGSHETYEIVAKHPHHHEGSSSNHVATVAEPHAGYFGHRRSLTSATPSSVLPSIEADASSEPAYDVNNNNYSTEDFAQMMAYRAHKQAAPIVSSGTL